MYHSKCQLLHKAAFLQHRAKQKEEREFCKEMFKKFKVTQQRHLETVIKLQKIANSGKPIPNPPKVEEKRLKMAFLTGF